MGTTAQRVANVFRQRADVRAFAAADFQLERRALERKQARIIHAYPPRCTFNLFPLAGQLVELFALMLQRRVHGRHLIDLTAKTRQDGFDVLDRKAWHLAPLQHSAFGIAGIGNHPQFDPGAIHLVGFQQVRGKLGGLPQADRQQACRHRVQRAGMPGFLRVEQTAHTLQRVIAGEAFRLIQQHHAIDR